jgi:hypothetical protein
MLRASLRGLAGTLNPGAALRDVGDAHGKMSPDRNLAEQRLYHAYF